MAAPSSKNISARSSDALPIFVWSYRNSEKVCFLIWVISLDVGWPKCSDVKNWKKCHIFLGYKLFTRTSNCWCFPRLNFKHHWQTLLHDKFGTFILLKPQATPCPRPFLYSKSRREGECCLNTWTFKMSQRNVHNWCFFFLLTKPSILTRFEQFFPLSNVHAFLLSLFQFKFCHSLAALSFLWKSAVLFCCWTYNSLLQVSAGGLIFHTVRKSC